MDNTGQNTGQMFEGSQSEGKIPKFNDCLKMTRRIGAISVAQLFNIKGAIFQALVPCWDQCHLARFLFC